MRYKFLIIEELKSYWLKYILYVLLFCVLRKIVFKSSKITNFGKKTFVGVPRKVDILIPRKKVKKYVKLIKQAK